jgi:protein-tyrosine-phosphatase
VVAIVTAPRGTDDVFGILFVCTGNLCRSPFAEFVTRHLLIDRLGAAHASRFSVISAGTHAAAGAGMHPLTRAELTPFGLDGAGAAAFVARHLDASTVRAADLVLTADRGHRSFVVDLVPAALPYAFCLREFARLLGGIDPRVLPADPVARAFTTVAEVRQLRGTLSYASPVDDIVPDPIGQPSDAHHRAAGMIASAVLGFVELLAGKPLRWPVQ